ncbi:leucine zipper putative tumor suppressor 2 homolog isoform X1 [Pecten maximus]|uniref:leucine zipper putative tumor suppressor 2 homolog isoform X1 n=1 Tax=Pecten maximus TaxID=6579 RepID=UPI0014587FC7|nr:leucine zipper putative tumor suppressor 2 homolog isoform X1 [Pecten maximus]XP_033756477.1 leucine zipper putative tumor suppressor 2 homolog isoform X1 [Pecten maximus]XP_033756478.1 leucine zipper putative tumor suppressor 2 homolog isoform X1 [Pecten maximus]XP_033756480.1 leucine zipper putative tumor suppressor 2 homolog isoform X1 [Pecten maximus]XP_033756481.1 leucine zipper putative tumor suppressor 2 homolog isoform X1 [Pecten maximus]XP_033756482.1 leucine zipper putative tumor 
MEKCHHGYRNSTLQCQTSPCNHRKYSIPVFESEYSTPSNQYDDYSHIQYTPNRKLSAPVAPDPPLRTSSVSSFMSDYTHRSYMTNHGSGHSSHSNSGHGNSRGINHGNGHGGGGVSQYYKGQSNPHNQHLHPPSRRKTWTPSGLKVGMTGNLSNSNSTSNVRNCHSNDLLENNYDSIVNGQVRGDDSEIAPPRLAPVSGILPRSPARGIIKPIAFKPVVLNHNYVNTRRMVDHRKYSQQDDGYGSQDYPMTNQRNVANMSHGSLNTESDRSASFSSDGHSKQFSPDRPESIRSFQMDSDHSTSFSSDGQSQKQYTPERSESIPSSNMSRISVNRLDGYVQTPSPSDSGVGELEAMLKEKDAEINTLRDVMEKNEKAIFQVYEEKKKSWSHDMKQVKDEYDQKLKVQQRKSYKTEQVLSLQVYKLQQEKKTMKEECDRSKTENEELKEKVKSYAQETERLELEVANISSHSKSISDDNESDLHLTVDSLNDSLALKTEEVIQLRKDLEEKQQELLDKDEEIGEKFREIVARTDEVQSLKDSLRRVSLESSIEMDTSCVSEKDLKSGGKSPNCDRVRSPGTSILAGEGLNEEVQRLRDEIEAHHDVLEKEREQWADEKNKVIRYQKQLQLNYVQMFRKNKLLEAEVEQLTLELESRDIKLMSINGEESVC